MKSIQIMDDTNTLHLAIIQDYKKWVLKKCESMFTKLRQICWSFKFQSYMQNDIYIFNILLPKNDLVYKTFIFLLIFWYLVAVSFLISILHFYKNLTERHNIWPYETFIDLSNLFYLFLIKTSIWKKLHLLQLLRNRDLFNNT